MPRARPTDRPTPTRHRWVVDRLAESTAAVEHDGDHVYDIPRTLLPGGTREGDVLDVEVRETEGEATVRVTRNEGEGKKAKEASKRQLRDARGKSGQGDISL